jgi:hypothetical protein
MRLFRPSNPATVGFENRPSGDLDTLMQQGSMLGDLIANLNRPDVAAAVLTTLDPVVVARIERRAAAAATAVADFAAAAVRDFMECADDELWLQLLTIMHKAENPGLAAIQAILGWVVAEE